MSRKKQNLGLKFEDGFGKNIVHGPETKSEGSPDFLNTRGSRRLMSYALWLLGRRRLTGYELVSRLKKRVEKQRLDMSMAEKMIEKIVARCRELNYINDEEYLRDFIESRLKIRPKGIGGLKYELKKKGIANDSIEKYFAENEIDESSVAMELAMKKLKSMARVSPEKQKSRVVMFLSSRGFKAETVYNTINKLFNNKNYV